MITRNAYKFFIAILGVMGLLLFIQTQNAQAGSNLIGGGDYLVDGGEIYEEQELSEFNVNYWAASGDDLVVPPRGIRQTSAAALPLIRIMPLGDSITKGTGTCSEPDSYLNCIGYREDLWNALVGNAYSFDFVGSQGTPYQYLYSHDNDHEGHGGWEAIDIKNNIYGSGLNWLQNYPADIILLHIGTNDIGGIAPPNVNQKISTIVNDVEQILNKIDQYEIAKNNEVLVVLARIINRIDPDGDEELYTTLFNQELQTMADSRVGDNIVVVDMEAALIYPDDLSDNLHPNTTGYSKMANVWFAALEQELNLSPTISGLEDQFFDQDHLPPSSIDLWAYAVDAETPDSGLTFSIENSPDPNAGVTLTENRYLQVDPSFDWCGYTDIRVRVTDPGGLWDEDTLRVAVTWTCKEPLPVPGQQALQDQPITLDLTQYEPQIGDGTGMVWSVTGEEHCVVTGEGSDDDLLTFTPHLGFVGSDEVTLHMTYPWGGEATQALTLTWSELETPVLEFRIYLPVAKRDH